MSSGIQLGDWVNTYSKGIYRVERIIDRYYDESSPTLDGNKIGDKYKDRIIISKRLLNSKFKKSISYETCSEYFVHPLNQQQTSELQKILAGDPSLLSALDKYQIPTIISTYTSELQIDKESDLKSVQQLIEFIKKGKSFKDIQEEMQRLDLLRLKPKNYGNYFFQLLNYDDEWVDKRLIWRDARLIKR